MPRNKGGRPDKYPTHVKPYLKEIPKWRKSGYKVEEVFKRLGIGKSTGYKIQKEHPEFAKALKAGTEELMFEIEDSLYRRALGYKYKETTKENRLNPDTGKYGLVTTKVVTKHMAPDVGAIAFSLKALKGIKYDNVQQRTVQLKEKEVNLQEKELEVLSKGVTINISPEKGDYSNED